MSQLYKTLEIYSIPKLQTFDKKKLYQKNKILNVLTVYKPCQQLLSFLTAGDIANLSSTCKLAKGNIVNHPSLFGILATNAVYERFNLNTMLINEQIKKLKDEVKSNEKEVKRAVKRYLCYNYTLTDMIESLAEDSMNGIEKLRLDMSDKAKSTESKGKVMSFFKSAFNIKEDKGPNTFKFAKISRIPIELQDKISSMISGTPFEMMMLLDDSSKQNNEYGSSGDYKVTQNKLFKEEIDKSSADFIFEFNGLISSLGRLWSHRGENIDSVRDFSFFLVKEVAKSYSYLRIILREHVLMSKLKEFLYAEVSSQHVELAIVRQQLLKVMNNINSQEYATVVEGSKRLEQQNLKLESENNRLKVNIIELNDYIGKCNKKIKAMEQESRNSKDAIDELTSQVTASNIKLQLNTQQQDLLQLNHQLHDILAFIDV